jgi:hypothetical protein
MSEIVGQICFHAAVACWATQTHFLVRAFENRWRSGPFGYGKSRRTGILVTSAPTTTLEQGCRARRLV